MVDAAVCKLYINLIRIGKSINSLNALVSVRVYEVGSEWNDNPTLLHRRIHFIIGHVMTTKVASPCEHIDIRRRNPNSLSNKATEVVRVISARPCLAWRRNYGSFDSCQLQYVKG